jgi:hypothetical protein
LEHYKERSAEQLNIRMNSKVSKQRRPKRLRWEELLPHPPLAPNVQNQHAVPRNFLTLLVPRHAEQDHVATIRELLTRRPSWTDDDVTDEVADIAMPLRDLFGHGNERPFHVNPFPPRTPLINNMAPLNGSTPNDAIEID